MSSAAIGNAVAEEWAGASGPHDNVEKKPAPAHSHGLPRSNQCCADITQSDSISRPDGPQLGRFETVFIGCRNGLSGKNPYFYVQVGRNLSSGNLFCLEFLFQFQYLM